MAGTSNYLDVLPLHPPPKRLESLTSYLARIANVNGIQFLADLSKLFDVNVSTDRPDLPPFRWERLPCEQDVSTPKYWKPPFSF
jgi:hypothetical protein